jgi:hypothetical protein
MSWLLLYLARFLSFLSNKRKEFIVYMYIYIPDDFFLARGTFRFPRLQDFHSPSPFLDTHKMMWISILIAIFLVQSCVINCLAQTLSTGEDVKSFVAKLIEENEVIHVLVLIVMFVCMYVCMYLCLFVMDNW